MFAVVMWTRWPRWLLTDTSGTNADVWRWIVVAAPVVAGTLYQGRGDATPMAVPNPGGRHRAGSLRRLHDPALRPRLACFYIGGPSLISRYP